MNSVLYCMCGRTVKLSRHQINDLTCHNNLNKKQTSAHRRFLGARQAEVFFLCCPLTGNISEGPGALLLCQSICLAFALFRPSLKHPLYLTCQNTGLYLEFVLKFHTLPLKTVSCWLDLGLKSFVGLSQRGVVKPVFVSSFQLCWPFKS